MFLLPFPPSQPPRTRHIECRRNKYVSTLSSNVTSAWESAEIQRDDVILQRATHPHVSGRERFAVGSFYVFTLRTRGYLSV